MFLDYFRLREQPFGVTPDPRYLFPSVGHREALASLLYGVETNLGFGALIAQPGMGKTTLLFHILEQYRKSARTAFIFNTQCNSYDLLRSLLSELEEDSSARDTFQLHEKFKHILASEAEKRRRVILVIDEAQNLGDMVMETVRLLSNFESAHTKLLHIILAGQQELATKLNRPELNQLQQRIPMLTHLPCLSAQDIASYIDHRLRVAGHQGAPLFTPEAVRQVVWLSRGIPREINRICFNSLSLAYASSKPLVDLTVLEEVAADLGLQHRAAEKTQWQEQHQEIAANSRAGVVHPPHSRTAEAWSQQPRGPQRVQPRPAKSEAPRSAPISPAMPVAPAVAANPGAHSRAAAAFNPHIQAHRARYVQPVLHPPYSQRVRRIRKNADAWVAVKRPLAYAFLCVTLIAAGWAAVTRWVHPTLTQAEVQNSTDASNQAPETSSPPEKVPTPASSTRNEHRAPLGNSAVANSSQSSGAKEIPSPTAGLRRSKSSTLPANDRPQDTQDRQTQLASARYRTPSPRPTPASHANFASPPVKEPSVAAEGQMQFVRYVRPLYPEEARDRHIEGTVVLSAVVGRDGTVKGVKPVSGDPLLLKAAESAVRNWIYRPYQINGRAVDVDTEIVINFALPKRLNP